MSLDPTSAKAARIFTAINRLGHIAMGQPLEEARRAMGDAKLRDTFHEDATIVFDTVEREERIKSEVFSNRVECMAALSQFKDVVQFIDFDDAASVAILKEHAQRALEGILGQPLPETPPE
jgi:hypothetical protein